MPPALFPFSSSVALGPEFGSKLYGNLQATAQRARQQQRGQVLDQAPTDPANVAATLQGLSEMDRGFGAQAIGQAGEVSGQLMGEDINERRRGEDFAFKGEQSGLNRELKQNMLKAELANRTGLTKSDQNFETLLNLGKNFMLGPVGSLVGHALSR